MANKADYPAEYGWTVAGSIALFLKVATQKLNSMLLARNLQAGAPVDNLKITFSAVTQNQRELGFGVQPELMPPRRWFAQAVESVGLLPEVFESI